MDERSWYEKLFDNLQGTITFGGDSGTGGTVQVGERVNAIPWPWVLAGLFGLILFMRTR